MIVPLEVEVSGVPGLYSPQHILDFGVLHTQSEPKSIPVFVINNSIKPVEITVSNNTTTFGRKNLPYKKPKFLNAISS